MNYITTPLEDHVANMYYKIGISEPDSSIEEIARRLGIVLLYRKKPSFSMEGVITLNPFTSKEVRKITFAHELYHTLYHVGTQIDMPHLFRQLQEWQATNFAYHFCVPTFMLQKLKLPAYRSEAITFIAETFCVTNQFAKERLTIYEKQIIGTLFHERLSSSKELPG
ncbi:ImmA/IrrE family metallo-endopeptidase [Lentibacillus jeotgali]|uniref:ImmA/IrrE family metallo-endopeptidase n=1 Tax=Lentibacillus jeotgali TaxID=558169 RepID=UPI0002628869|nr:ImmA/IrrE family metallo-endopeptidase [Lentibacillus jeotgali]